MVDITGAFEKDNGRSVLDIWAEEVLSVCNTYFEHNSLHNCNKVARG